MSVRITKDLGVRIKTFREENQFSPDISKLQSQLLLTPVFLYGNEKKGFSEHFRVKDYPCLGYGHTRDRTYIMCKSVWHSPIAMNRPNAPTASHLGGHVYLVSPEVLFDLDSAYEVGPFFTRYRRKIIYVDQTDEKRKRWVSDCWVYTGKFEAFGEKIKEGKCELMRPGLLQSFSVGAYYWHDTDDAPNRARLAELRAASRAKDMKDINSPYYDPAF